MAKPVLLTLDDDPEVLRAIERDLRRRYGARYRVLRASSGASALDALRQLKLRNEAVALMLVDQRMPQMQGVDFLEQAIKLFPDAKRLLLTAYADTEAAIKAINEVQIDYYLRKPWDPPETQLYPILDDLLDKWDADYRPPFEGVRVVGHRWLPEGYQLKNLLARNHVTYQWLDVEVEAEAQQLVEIVGVGRKDLPLVILPDGSQLVRPSIGELAERVGLQMHAQMPFYDLIIIGAGPAGLAAAVYAASEGLKTLMIEKDAPGGQAGTSSRIENYLGFPDGVSGDTLARSALQQAVKFGVEILVPQSVSQVRVDEQYRYITPQSGSEIGCYALLLATGVAYRKLAIPDIDKFQDAGVYYGAAATEAQLCAGEQVFIVGAGNSAGQAAMFLSEEAAKVIMVVRGDSLGKSMSQYLVDRILKTSNIEVRLLSEIVSIQGDQQIESVTIIDKSTREQETIPGTAVFSFIGAEPNTEWLKGVVACDDRGFILAGPDLLRDGRRPPGWHLDRDPYLLETSVPGIFVAGDVRHGSVKRVASGVGEGSIVVQFIHQYLSQVQ